MLLNGMFAFRKTIVQIKRNPDTSTESIADQQPSTYPQHLYKYVSLTTAVQISRLFDILMSHGLVIFVAVRGHFHGPGDVRALGMKIAIDLEALGIIPHAVQHVPGNVEHIGVCFGSDLSGHNDMTAGGHDLTGDAAGRVTGQTRIQNIVCDEVAEFVGVAFGDRFGRIKSSHSFLLCLLM